jgi:hypothetical protein
MKEGTPTEKAERDTKAITLLGKFALNSCAIT